MHRRTFGPRNVLTVGEAWSATPATALLYSGRDRNELSMVFQFEHVTQQWDRERGKWKPLPFDLVALKAVLNKWQLALAEDGWNALFWGNHDLPRAVSKYGDTTGHHTESAKMLATVLHLMKGTPFVYQGEEIGMTNVPFTSIEQYRDIETLNMHRLHLEAGLSAEDFIVGANANGRDNARTPMQWTAAEHGGFTTGVPWIEVNQNFTRINVAQSVGDDRSIWNHYRKLIALRKAHPVIVYGRYQPYLERDPNIFAYTRTLGAERLLVMGNFSAQATVVTMPEELRVRGQCLVANYDERQETGEVLRLQPYEAFAILSSEG
jgi:oligo-1,6-glucosidase